MVSLIFKPFPSLFQINFLVVAKNMLHYQYENFNPNSKRNEHRLAKYQATSLKPESQAVLDALALYSASQLKSFYKVSAEKAEEEFSTYPSLEKQTAQHYPALKLFDGLMYRHIKRDKLNDAEQAYLENHVFITSAL